MAGVALRGNGGPRAPCHEKLTHAGEDDNFPINGPPYLNSSLRLCALLTCANTDRLQTSNYKKKYQVLVSSPYYIIICSVSSHCVELNTRSIFKCSSQKKYVRIACMSVTVNRIICAILDSDIFCNSAILSVEEFFFM